MDDFRSMFENAPLGMFRSSPEGGFRLVNRALARMLGYDSPELLVASVKDIAREIYVHPERRAEILRIIQEAGRETDPAAGSVARFDTEYYRRDGSTFTAKLTVSVVRAEDGSVAYLEGMVEDVSESRAMEASLRETTALLGDVLAAIPDKLSVYDSAGSVVYSNWRAELPLSLLQEGCPVCGRVREGALCPVLSVLRTGEPSYFEEERSFDVGRPGRMDRVLSVALLPVGLVGDGNEAGPSARVEGAQRGRPGMVLEILRDVTEEQRARRLREDVERLTRHDLKSHLLAAVHVPVLLRKEGNLTLKQEELLDSLEDSSRRMLDLMERAMALYRIEGGLYKITPKPLELLGLLNEVAAVTTRLFSEKRLNLAVKLFGREAASSDVFWLTADGPLLFSLFLSLLKNAAEASPRGETVQAEISEECGDAGCAPGEDDGSAAAWQGRAATEVPHCLVAIHNKGAVPEAVRGTFFQKFATHGKVQGTGLGAYSARLIARMHGGDAGFCTSEEEGTTLFVRLPLTP